VSSKIKNIVVTQTCGHVLKWQGYEDPPFEKMLSGRECTDCEIISKDYNKYQYDGNRQKYNVVKTASAGRGVQLFCKAGHRVCYTAEDIHWRIESLYPSDFELFEPWQAGLERGSDPHHKIGGMMGQCELLCLCGETWLKKESEEELLVYISDGPIGTYGGTEAWYRWSGVASPCKSCHGAGRVEYATVETWRGRGRKVPTWGVCDICWGTGDKNRKGIDLGELMAQHGIPAVLLYPNGLGFG